jgi:hypothetical protein
VRYERLPKQSFFCRWAISFVRARRDLEIHVHTTKPASADWFVETAIA